MLRGRAVTALSACVVAASVIVLLWAYQVSIGHAPALALDEAGGVFTPVGRCFAGFVIGMGVFRLASWPGIRRIGSDLFGAAVTLTLATFWLMRGTPDLLLYACLPCLILCLALNRGQFAAVFSSRPVWLLGEWSYSIYLTHIFLIHGRERTFNLLARHMAAPLADTLGAIIFFGLTIAVSAACFSLIEVPARRRLRPLIEARRVPIELEPSAP